METTTGKMQPTPAKYRDCPPIEVSPIDEDQRGRPGHRHRAADRIERRAPGRHGAQAVLRQDQRQGETECRTQRQQRRRAGRGMAGPLTVCYVRRLSWRRGNYGHAHLLERHVARGQPGDPGPARSRLLVGLIVFDGGRAFEGCGPDLDLHAERAVRSARALGLCTEQDREGNPRSDARGGPPLRTKARLYVRPMFWAGKGRAGRSRSTPSTQFLLCVYHSPMRGHAADARSSAPSAGRRAGERTNCRKGELPLSKFIARRRRDDEARLQNGVVLDAAGNVAETCSSNIFIARNGVVATPVPNGTFLAGITRYRTVAPAQRRPYGRGANCNHGRARRRRRDLHHGATPARSTGQPLRKPRPATRPDRPPGARTLHGLLSRTQRVI